jgi:RHS repeat-associated protein
MRRLTNVDSTRALDAGNEPQDFQHLVYTFDPVGNITHVENVLAVPPKTDQKGLLGPVAQTFEYDDLYQLSAASGLLQYRVDRSQKYTLTIDYDELGNITRKAQNDVKVDVVDGRTIETVDDNTTRTWVYEYKSTRPHAPSKVGPIKLDYDGNGNRKTEDGSSGEPDRKLTWTEDNLLRKVEEGSNTAASFLYDANGVRTQKKTGSSGPLSLYPNQYFTVRRSSSSSRTPTKHIYLGDTRVASRTGDGSKPTYFFFHPDHLQSTEFVTDSKGVLLEREEYFPFGESWISHGDEPTSFHFKFNAKELDDETGFYYFGARYYDPRVSQWASPDPMLASFMASAPGGGGLTPANLGLYGYTWNNPVVLRDPSGLEVEGEMEAETRTPEEVRRDPLGVEEMNRSEEEIRLAVYLRRVAAEGTNPTPGMSHPEDDFYYMEAREGRINFHAETIGAARGSEVNYSRVPEEMRGSPPEVAKPEALMSIPEAASAECQCTPVRTSGETSAAAEGRAAHRQFAERVKERPGWQSEPRIVDPATGRIVKPDATTRRGNPVELKPDTKTGRQAGKRQIKMYERVTGKKGRVIYYTPKRSRP